MTPETINNISIGIFILQAVFTFFLIVSGIHYGIQQRKKKGGDGGRSDRTTPPIRRKSSLPAMRRRLDGNKEKDDG